MLEILTFDVVLQSPYNFLYNNLQKLNVEEIKPLRNVAWAFLNDSCLTMLCLIMPPKDIAAGAIYFAAKGTQTQIPDDEYGVPWWEQIGGNAELITKAVGVMNDFYTENPLKRTDNPYEQSPASGNEDDLERTRGRGYSNAQTPNEDGARSQHSQNGNNQDNRTPVMNGNGTGEHVSQTTDNGRPESPLSQAPPSGITTAPQQTVESSRSSEAALKEAANDPATHEKRTFMSGDSLLTNQQGQSDTVKRKEFRSAQDRAVKRLKKDSGGESASMIMSEASEEGELEE